MDTSQSPTGHHMAQTAFQSLFFLTFFQLLSDFIETTYAFGLLQTSLPPEVVSVLIFFTPLLLLLGRREPPTWLLYLLASLTLLCRAIEVNLAGSGKMLTAGLGVGAFWLFLPAYFSHLNREKASQAGLTLGVALTFAVSLAAMFKALNSGVDLTVTGGTRWLAWVLTALCALLLPAARGPTPGTADLMEEPQSQGKQGASLWRTTTYVLGMTAAFALLYFTFTSPNVIARWTRVSYTGILLAFSAIQTAFVLLLVTRPGVVERLPRSWLIAWNAIFTLSVALVILAHQVPFPSDPRAYPLYEPSPPAWHLLALGLMLLTSPIILLDGARFSQALSATNPTSRSLGAAFSLGSLLFLILIFGQVFTTVYDYIPLVGPFFRDRFWLVFLGAGVMLGLPAFLKHPLETTQTVSWRPQEKQLLPATSLLIGVLTIGGAYLRQARPAPPPAGAHTLRVLTYNIQQGYSPDGHRNYDGQLDLIQKLDPDLIGLQESDTNRVSGGNADVVRYIADRLGMYAYYGPKTVTGTFGIALLSKYPLQNPRTFFMYSTGEQTAGIEAQITADGKTFNVLVTHLGNDGPIIQQEAVRQTLASKENIILMGDFNFRPDSDQYRLTTQTLVDSWAMQGSADPGFDPQERIDHIFLSPELGVVEARYHLSPQSDHPALTTTIGW